jgi:hypothetical protein
MLRMLMRMPPPLELLAPVVVLLVAMRLAMRGAASSCQ